MIPIDQWRAAIGCFNPRVGNGFGKVLCRGSTCSYYNIKPFILVIIIVSSIVLIMAGDVELNPGPRGFRKCPQCQQDIPIKSKTCGNCGLPQNSHKSIETKRTQWNKQYYQSQKIEILAQRRENYNKHAEELKAVSKMNYDANPKRKKATSCARYKSNPEKKKLASCARYKSNPEKKKLASCTRYKSNPEKMKLASRTQYKINPQKQKLASRTQYKINPEKRKLASCARYKSNPEKKKLVSRTQYKINPQKQKLASVSRYKTNAVKLKSIFKANYARNHDSRIKYFKAQYANNKTSICEYKRSKYVLAEPKPAIINQHVKQIQCNLLQDSQIFVQLIKAHKKQHPDLAKRMSRAINQAVCKIAAKKVLNKALQVRKVHVGSLLKNIRLIKCLDIKEKEDFGKRVHSAASEPYYFDAAYQLVEIDLPIPVDENGKCMITNIITNPDIEIKMHIEPLKWQCHSQCKPLTIAEVNAIVLLKEEFQKPMKEVLHTLQVCDDDCPNQHFSRSVEASPNNDLFLDCNAIDRQGHPLVCFNDSKCFSKLRILRAASTHYPVLRNFLHAGLSKATYKLLA